MNKWYFYFILALSLTGCSQTIHEPIWENCSHANCSSNNTDTKNVLLNPQHLSEN